MEYYLPKGTQTIINKSQLCCNLRLLLDKYVPQDVVNKDEAIDKKKVTKGNWLRKIVTSYEGDGALAKAAYHRWYSYTSALQATHFSETIDWRMVVGLGGNSILETDITLHHLYGLPIIPGSALKGLTRTYAAIEEEKVYIADFDGRMRPSTAIETDHNDIRRIFGMQDRAGTVIFFDAFPKTGQASFVLDIMNLHYPDYYQKNAAPTNDQNPKLITFLAVHHTSYMFALALRQGVPEKYKEDLATAKIWLSKALAAYGVGGKTSAGYGYFREIIPQPPLPEDAYTQPQPAKPIDPDLKKAEGYKREVDVLNNVAGQIHGYYQKWQQLNLKEARLLLAQAIIDKVRQAGREKVTSEKPWYKELRAFLDMSQS